MRLRTIDDVVPDRGSEVMHTLPAAATVTEAVDLMSHESIGAVLVMTEENLVAGIFTERDLLNRVVRPGRDPKTTPLSMVMTPEVRFVTPTTPVEAAMALMHVQRHRHLYRARCRLRRGSGPRPMAPRGHRRRIRVWYRQQQRPRTTRRHLSLPRHPRGLPQQAQQRQRPHPRRFCR